MADRGDTGADWNPSRDDPWWREWLTSRELFVAFVENIPRLGERIGDLLGGVVGRYDSGRSCIVEVWIGPGEVVVAYPAIGPEYGGLHEFGEWIRHLRESEPLELGRVRGRSSYGARCEDGAALPIVKWGQAGDWAALARHWLG